MLSSGVCRGTNVAYFQISQSLKSENNRIENEYQQNPTSPIITQFRQFYME